VLYAPGPTDLEELREIVASVELPVNVLVRPGAPSVAELASLGVSRVSVGGALAFAALGAVVEAAGELREQGTYEFWQRAGVGVGAVRSAFG
jgi:2-methylisocitrate lyase-like PEP mutase family enzyme